MDLAGLAGLADLGAEEPRLGLRERKKRKTREAIRRATYRLIAEQGYEATSVEQIAEAAEVSPSTVFRYFPTKEDIVLTDEYDPVMVAALRSRPADEPPLESLRFVMHAALRAMQQYAPEEMEQRTRLMVEIPAVRARMTQTMSATSELLAGALAERTRRDPGDLEVRVFTAALLGGLREATLYWGEQGFKGDLVELVDRTLDMFTRELTL
ncbi:TetR/AcrR family transcriptional regulator [Streptomyces sp. NPDC002851]